MRARGRDTGIRDGGTSATDVDTTSSWMHSAAVQPVAQHVDRASPENGAAIPEKVQTSGVRAETKWGQEQDQESTAGIREMPLQGSGMTLRAPS